MDAGAPQPSGGATASRKKAQPHVFLALSLVQCPTDGEQLLLKFGGEVVLQAVDLA